MASKRQMQREKLLDELYADGLGDLYIKKKINIHTWRDYYRQLCENGVILEQLQDLSGYIQFPEVMRTVPECCFHTQFQTKEIFLSQFSDYVINKNLLEAHKFRDIMEKHEHRGVICHQCSIDLLIKSHGLRHFFNQIKNFLNKKHTKQNTFLKYFYDCSDINQFCITLPSYRMIVKPCFLMNCNHIAIIRDLLFKTMSSLVQSKNTTDFLESNIIHEYYFKFWPLYGYCCFNSQVNKCFTFERSLILILKLVSTMITFFRLKHIELFCIKWDQISFAFPTLFHVFIKRYMLLPHMKVFSDSINRYVFCRGARIRRGTRSMLFIDEFDGQFYEWLHPILFEFMTITQFVVAKIKYYCKKLKLTIKKLQQQDEGKNKLLINQLKKRRGRLVKVHQQCVNAATLEDTESNCIFTQIAFVPMSTMYENVLDLEYAFDEEVPCANCLISNALWGTEKNGKTKQWPKFKTCKGCKIVKYCSRRCQKYDWNIGKHKQQCSQLAAIFGQ